MDLLKTLQMNRAAVQQIEKMPVQERQAAKKTMRGTPSGLPEPTEHTPGTKAYRHMIIEEKPSKKKVKEHLEALIAFECESSDDE